MPTTRSLPAAALLVALAGCAAVPPGPVATLPSDSVAGAGDPTRAAILGTAYAFSTPASLTGRPAEAARAAADFEYLAVELPQGPRWVEFTPVLATELARGQQELRAALGIVPGAPPQAVIDSLYATSRALNAGDQPAAERILSRPVFGPAGGAATLQRLAALPPLPRTGFAAMLAKGELDRQDRGGRNRGGGGFSGGRS